MYAYKDFISLINRFIYSFYFAICTNCLHQTNVYIEMLKTTHTQCIAHAAVLNDVCTCVQYVGHARYLSTIWYDFDKHFYVLRRKSTHIYYKMYNFMTLKKKKNFFGREAFYGRSDVDNQTIYFFWPNCREWDPLVQFHSENKIEQTFRWHILVYSFQEPILAFPKREVALRGDCTLLLSNFVLDITS